MKKAQPTEVSEIMKLTKRKKNDYESIICTYYIDLIYNKFAKLFILGTTVSTIRIYKQFRMR